MTYFLQWLGWLGNEKGCFGGSGKSQSLPLTPDPAPMPSPAPSPEEQVQTQEQKRTRIGQLKAAGLMSTIKNTGGAVGLTGQGADLSNPQAAKKTLG